MEDDFEYTQSPYTEEMPNALSEEEANFSQWQLDPEPIIRDLQNLLKGKEKNGDGVWVLPENPNPRVNDKGVQDIISSLRMGIFNKFTPLSILDEEKINSVCFMRGHILANMLMSKHKEYDIDPRDILTLQDDIMTSVFINLSRAKGGKTLMGIQKIYKMLEKTGDSKEENGGLISGIFSRSKGGK